MKQDGPIVVLDSPKLDKFVPVAVKVGDQVTAYGQDLFAAGDIDDQGTSTSRRCGGPGSKLVHGDDDPILIPRMAAPPNSDTTRLRDSNGRVTYKLTDDKVSPDTDTTYDAFIVRDAHELTPDVETARTHQPESLTTSRGRTSGERRPESSESTYSTPA